MFEVGSRNEVALAVMATAVASRPAEMRWRCAARSETGIATITATSRLTSALSSAVSPRTAAAEAIAGPRPGTTSRVTARKAPSRSASADPTTIAASVANGPTVARKAAPEACVRRPMARAARPMPAAHRTRRRTSLCGDVILADSLVISVVKERVLLLL